MATVQRATYFRADLKDKPGALLKVLEDLKSRNVGLTGLWGFSMGGGKAQLYVVGKNPGKLKRAWKKGKLLKEQGVGFVVRGSDRTGALISTLQALKNAKVNIQAIDAIAVAGKYGSFIWVNKGQERKAAKALGVE
jgi:prephenate dehydratase